MSLEFLFDEWFVKVKEICEFVGDVEVFVVFVDLVINIIVKIDDGEKYMVMVGGMIEEGYYDDVFIMLILFVDLVKCIFIEGD